mmetsp:Transcript_5354/g.16306  ORF Transcript_5354/g.16306 Transcript_5354/m.16306 type:complete len:156 (+) Transcript_5354:196-663(+)
MDCAATMVASRCATTIDVRPFCSVSRACCTSASLSASSADVASSSSNTRGDLMMARAMATRCFCPPDSCVPPSPTSVSYPLGSARMKTSALAARAAASTSPSLAPGMPNKMLSLMVPEKSTGSWLTRPKTCCRSQSRLSPRMSCPSSSTAPSVGS